MSSSTSNAGLAGDRIKRPYGLWPCGLVAFSLMASHSVRLCDNVKSLVSCSLVISLILHALGLVSLWTDCGETPTDAPVDIMYSHSLTLF